MVLPRLCHHHNIFLYWSLSWFTGSTLHFLRCRWSSFILIIIRQVVIAMICHWTSFLGDLPKMKDLRTEKCFHPSLQWSAVASRPGISFVLLHGLPASQSTLPFSHRHRWDGAWFWRNKCHAHKSAFWSIHFGWSTSHWLQHFQFGTRLRDCAVQNNRIQGQRQMWLEWLRPEIAGNFDYYWNFLSLNFNSHFREFSHFLFKNFSV